MPPADRVFKTADLDRAAREIVEAARAGEARLRDVGGSELAVLPAERLAALREGMRAVVSLFAVEDALARDPAHRPDPVHFGDWTWLQPFEPEELRRFTSELRASLAVLAEGGSADLLHETLSRWRVLALGRKPTSWPWSRDEEYFEIDRP